MSIMFDSMFATFAKDGHKERVDNTWSNFDWLHKNGVTTRGTRDADANLRFPLLYVMWKEAGMLGDEKAQARIEEKRQELLDAGRYDIDVRTADNLLVLGRGHVFLLVDADCFRLVHIDDALEVDDVIDNVTVWENPNFADEASNWLVTYDAHFSVMFHGVVFHYDHEKGSKCGVNLSLIDGNEKWEAHNIA